MTAIPEKKLYTFEEYLALEEASETRYEYWDGEVFAMAGTTKRHNRLVLRLAGLLESFALRQGCAVFAENVKQQLVHRSRYVYPDIIYTCDADDLEDDLTMLVKSPCLLIEVLSDSTKTEDTTTKLTNYFRLPSLQAYLLVSQKKIQIQVYERANDFLKCRTFTDIEDIIHLEKLGITLRLADVYAGFNLKAGA